MINRTLLRIKTIQIIYSFYKSGSTNISTAEKELLFSIAKSHELYNYLLLLIIEITRLAQNRIELGRNKLLPTPEELNPNTRFIDNKLAKLLDFNAVFRANVEERKLSWKSDFTKQLLDELIRSDGYEAYMNAPENSFERDKHFWVDSFKNVILESEALDDLLEDESVYWNDDVSVVGIFVLKTIKRYSEDNNGNNILPMFKDDDDRNFVCRLLRTSLSKATEFRKLIDDNARNWDIERVAFMDIIIMQTALAELTAFPEIPANVTFNEYLEIAKSYSTDRSSLFINGLLDKVYSKLKAQNMKV